MRFCLFTPVFLPDVGGTEVVTDALAREFQAQGHEIVVVARGGRVELDVPYPIWWVPKPILPHWFPDRIARGLAAAHGRHDFELFAANYSHPTGHAALRLGRRVGVPVVVTSHGGDLYHSSKHRNQPSVWKRTVHTYNHADGLVAISAYVEGLIRQINPNPVRIERIPNGIDPDRIRGAADRPGDFDDTRPFALCLGNFTPMKGFDDAITAWASCHDRLGDLALVLVGDGEMEVRLRDQVSRLEMTRNIIFAGRRTGADKRWFLQNCRFGLMPSIEEGHPIVALELLAAGKPLICTTNAAFDGMYDHGKNCLRVPPRDTAGLAHALVTINGADLAAMSRRSYERAESYRWPAIARRYIDFFRRVIDEHRAGI